jgi:peroxiredoxin
MKKHYTLALSLALMLVFAASSYAQGSKVAGSDDSSLPGPAIGQTIADFTLPDADGKKHSLNSLKGAKGTVLIFVATRCPVSNSYNERMAKLAQDFAARGINVVGVNSNVTEPADEVKQHAAEHNLSFTILKDNDGKIADLFGAQHTPEAYLLDASNKLIYRGGIDNSRSGDTITASYLRDAMDETIAGKPVTRARALAFGCSIKRRAD